MIDLQNQEDLFAKLAKLNDDMIPAWGKMTARHIVEHLTLSLQISTGKGPQKLYLTAEESENVKQKIINTDSELPLGIKTPLLGDEPAALIYPDLETAITNLRVELNYFNNYFDKNSDARHMHPRMGLLNFKEWTILHNKHFTHHLKQFGLV